MRGYDVPAGKKGGEYQREAEAPDRNKAIEKDNRCRARVESPSSAQPDSPYKLKLKLAVEGLTPDITRYSIVPEEGKTPFTAKLCLTVSPRVVGIYPFKVIARDAHGRDFGAENLVLIILPPELPIEVVNQLRTLVAFYRAYGVQYVILVLTSILV